MLYYPQAALWVVGLAPLCQVVEGLTQGGFSKVKYSTINSALQWQKATILIVPFLVINCTINIAIFVVQFKWKSCAGMVIP